MTTTQNRMGRATAPGTHAIGADPSTRFRRRVLVANGAFLALVGGAQVVFELLSHFAGVGPLGGIFRDSPYTIGFLEAHGLALILGSLMIRAGLGDAEPVWHRAAIAVHVLLGGANLLFWQSFVEMGFVPMGVVATTLHGVFLAAEAWCAARARR